METIIIIALILATLIMIAIHHLYNWGTRKVFSNDSYYIVSVPELIILGLTLTYIVFNVLYIKFLFVIFIELTKIT